jgi:hemerythrin-like domain-containing protein
MTEKTAVDILDAEHRVIEKVVAAAAVLAETLETGGAVEGETLQQVVAFMRGYADKCHHGKEEAELFPFLERRGVPMRGCPVGALTGEHTQGRALVAALSDSTAAYAEGDASAREALLASLHGITTLYPNHIWKEDYLLFPMSNKVLSAEDQQELLARFQQVEEGMGHGTHEQFEQLAADLERRVRGF